ncbi:MAG: flagellar basal body-associated FliL family protein [Rubellimicrobium sp.]|nr:flagellar basal body-associated FliL family protein [Rubellimicrobium sp.]
MTAVADTTEPEKSASAKRPLIIGLVLALAGAGGGFVGMRLLLPGPDGPATAEVSPEPGAVQPLAPMAYLALEPLLVTLPRASGREFLRFAATLEVVPAHEAEVQALLPRIVDVMNGYLRAIEPADFESRTILAELRSQLLRRIQVVTGEGRVRDLLVIEFVLN